MKKIPLQYLTLFFRQLAALVKAKIPLLQSCHILSQSEQNQSLNWVIQIIKNDIESGLGFAKGLQKFPTVFNHLLCHLVETGEQTGTLDRMLSLIVILLEKSLKIRNQIKQALFYPLTVLMISLIVCLMMLVLIVPRFAEFFQSLHGQLPIPTRIIINVSSFIRENYIYIICFIILLLITFSTLKLTTLFKNQWILKLPLVRQFLIKIFILHFSRNLAIVYSAGITITDGLDMIAHTYIHSEFTSSVHNIKNKVMAGQQLNMAMHSCLLFPPLVTQMIRIGEESGELQAMLETIVNLYENSIDQMITRMNQCLEPLIMIILGALIGGLIIAMYLPIFKLGMMI